MIRLIAFLYRHPNLTKEEFAHHWKHVHGPLIRDEPTLARHLVRYVQNSPLVDGPLAGTALAGSVGVDGVTEQWFRSQEDFVAFVSEPAYRKLIGPDEAKFLDQSRTQFMLTEALGDVTASDQHSNVHGQVQDQVVVIEHGGGTHGWSTHAKGRPHKETHDVAHTKEPASRSIGPIEPSFDPDSVFVITGGASGIGRDLATHLVHGLGVAGSSVVIIDRNNSAVAATARDIGCTHVTADVAVSNDFEDALNGIWSAVGPITHVVNSAGGGNLKPFESYSDKELSLLWQVNVMGTYTAIRSLAPRMKKGSAILNIASVSGVRPTIGEAPYSAAKAAVISLTQAAALEFAPKVRVNCISPGFIHTPLNDMIVSNPELRETLESGTPLGRLGQPHDVSAPAAFLLSSQADYITGQNLIVDGGSLLNSKQMDDVLAQMIDTFSSHPGTTG